MIVHYSKGCEIDCERCGFRFFVKNETISRRALEGKNPYPMYCYKCSELHRLEKRVEKYERKLQKYGKYIGASSREDEYEDEIV